MLMEREIPQGNESLEIDIINPELPEQASEKLALLHRCLATLALGGRVEGVTPITSAVRVCIW